MTTTASPVLPIARPLLDEREVEAARRVILSGWVTQGPEVAAFEREFAAAVGAPHAVAVSNCTTALHLALLAAGVGPGDEVITTPYTFFATGGTVARVGARSIFCDIDPKTYNLDPKTVQAFIDKNCERRDGKLINKKTGGHIKVLMPVHLYGQMADMAALMPIARANGLKVIEDAAQAIGSATPDGKRAGSIGDIGCFSFFPS